MIELKNNKTTYLGKTGDGRDKFAIDGFIGPVQMREPDGVWQDIKPRLIRDADGWHIEGAPYYAEVKDDGSRLFCPDRNDRGKFISLPTIELVRRCQKNMIYSPSKLNGEALANTIRMPTTWGHIEYIFTNTGLKFQMLIEDAAKCSKQCRDRLAFDIDSNLDVAQLLQSKQGLGIPRPKLVDSNDEPQQHWLDWAYKNGQLGLDFDLTGLTFPVLLQNTTIDNTVDAGADDSQEQEDTGACSPTDVIVRNYAATAASNRKWGGYRWDVALTQGWTIGVCYSSLYCYTVSYDDADLNIHFEYGAAPAAFSATAFDITGRTRTTNSSLWQANAIAAGGVNYYDTPSLVTPLQEVVNDYTTSQLVMITRPNQTQTKYLAVHAFEITSSNPAKIHIEYSTGAAAYIPKVIFM